MLLAYTECFKINSEYFKVSFLGLNAAKNSVCPKPLYYFFSRHFSFKCLFFYSKTTFRNVAYIFILTRVMEEKNNQHMFLK